MRKICLLLLLVLLYSLAAANTPVPSKAPMTNLPLSNGSENVNAPICYPPYNIPLISATDEIGDTIMVGTTWWEDQHNGTVGRMLAKDADGYMHMAWTNGLDNGANTRHVYYNYIDPAGEQGWPRTGIQVDNANRGGYTTMDVDFGGIPIIALHEVLPGYADPITAMSNDILPRTGGFLTWDVPNQPPPGMVNQVIWPRMQIDNQQRIQFVSTEDSPGLGDRQRIMYSYGTFNPGTFTIEYPTPNTWTYVDTTMTIAADLATSEVSNKVAIAWTHPREVIDTARTQYDNDVYYVVSNDGVNFDFANPINLTNFIPPNPELLPDTTAANKDTIRAYTDLNCFYDENDFLHITFTTSGYYDLQGTISVASSLIWHWSEQYPWLFSLVANGWIYSEFLPAPAPGAWNRVAQRPCVGQDPQTGYLYCMYQQYMMDSLAVSQGGFPSGDVFISVSTNDGLDWSVGTNVTNTQTPDGAPPGQCLSELTPSMAKVVDDYCNLLYVLDRDAGDVNQTEGTWTLNTMYYHKVPKNSILQTPLIGHEIPFHVGEIWGINSPAGAPTVKKFDLQQNYPNPFNPTTAISFSLEKKCEVSLNVYNLRGELVSQLATGSYNAGSHTFTFDGSTLSSGVYIYRLAAGSYNASGKMVLLK